MDTPIAVSSPSPATVPLFNQTQIKALSLLSSGVTPEQCALALGLTPSAISQMVSDEVFAGRLAEMKFDALRKHNARDDELDALEDALIAQLKTNNWDCNGPNETSKITSDY
jgi:hypothetical protein